MSAEPTIGWMKKKNSVSGPLPPGTSLWLRSRGHQNPPVSYRIRRRNPKPWWKIFGKHADWLDEAPLDAIPLVKAGGDPGGVYRSANEWQLGGPNEQIGRAEFQAWTDDDASCSGVMCSAFVWIATLEMANKKGWEAGGSLASTGNGKVTGTIGGRGSKQQIWKVRAPKDPAVQIRVLQGGEVRSYLEAANDQISKLNSQAALMPMKELLSYSSDYFETEPLEAKSFDTFIGPDVGFDVEMELPVVDGLKAAIALEVIDQDNGSVARSDPIFVTDVGDRLVVTDLTPDLLRDEPRRMLTAFAESNSDVNVLAERLYRDRELLDVWNGLVDATEELGAGSVGDAAAFMAATGQTAAVAGVK